jgi:hypothetical protein
MLADSSHNVQTGAFDKDLHVPWTYKIELFDFITGALPLWRDDGERPAAESETELTEHLCDYLNGTTRKTDTWSQIQFRTETRDENKRGRTIDLSPKPATRCIVIEGRRHTKYQALFPIECKRLPTPKSKERDEREYVITEPGTTGGIQRYKFGYHGAAHDFGGMIGYIQSESTTYWFGRVNGWINDLAKAGRPDWSNGDILDSLTSDTSARLSTMKSRHARNKNGNKIELRHAWICMH